MVKSLFVTVYLVCYITEMLHPHNKCINLQLQKMRKYVHVGLIFQSEDSPFTSITNGLFLKELARQRDLPSTDYNGIS